MRNNEEQVGKIASGNVKARIRMILLYDIARRVDGMVLGTDNLTEYLLGFWTLHGDVGDYSPIQYLWKTEVYALSQHLIKECGEDRSRVLLSCIEATPTDGLGITHSDLDQLGAGCYEEVDKILKAYLAGKLPKKMMDHPVIQRHLRSKFKRNNPFNISRATLLK
jgi:NAD+ synthetase